MHRVRPLLAWMTGAIGQPYPDRLPFIMDLLWFLILLDAGASFWTQRVCKEPEQTSLWRHFLTGLWQAFALLAAGSTASVIMGHWVEFESVVVALVGMEALNLITAAVKWQNCGGSSLGPLKPLLARLTASLGNQAGNPPQNAIQPDAAPSVVVDSEDTFRPAKRKW
jgi:hypothetical protein